ncbi:MAG: carboxypeptidase-like regulatory domain-containing protein [Cyclobacteriaceae bacterium]
MRLFVVVTLVLVGFLSNAQQRMFGKITDASTNEPLPFATISFKGTTKGTISNKNGEFALTIQNEQRNTPVEISYIGYKSQELNPKEGEMLVKLIPDILTLDELIIRPLPPTAYIKRAVSKFSQNYPTAPFTSQAYYREKFSENDAFINMTEAVFQSYYPNYQDTLDNQHQLILHRRADELSDIAFMSGWVDKRNRKDKRKAEKKGEEYKEEDPTADLREGFGGPDVILEMDLIRGLDECLDSTMFKKFKYSFGDGLFYQGRELMVIHFKSKGTVDHMKSSGVIYLDVETDAIVSLEYEGKAIIPILVRPLIAAMGLGISNPNYDKKITYQFHEGKWYPDNFQWHFDLRLSKFHWIKSNEKSIFEGAQVLKVTDINTSNPNEIPEDKRFNTKESFEEQVQNEMGLNWDEINVLMAEEAF